MYRTLSPSLTIIFIYSWKKKEEDLTRFSSLSGKPLIYYASFTFVVLAM